MDLTIFGILDGLMGQIITPFNLIPYSHLLMSVQRNLQYFMFEGS